MDIVNRLKKYMEHVQLPISQFADIALIPRPTLSQILSGRNKKISNELMSKLHDAFPKLNISWLLFGDGPMEIDSPYPNENSPAAAKRQTSSADTVSLFDIDEDAKHPQPIPDMSRLASDFSSQPISVSPDANKRVQSIMVFYNDNSFEIFTPSQR